MDAGESEASGSTSDIPSPLLKKMKKEKRKEKKHKKKKRKRRTTDSEPENCKSSKSKKRKKSKEKERTKKVKVNNTNERDMPGPSIPPDLLVEKAIFRAPMTKEEWEKSQSVIRRVYDETTGRTRLVKGDGEVLEEIVSRDRHREINKQATSGDGVYFQNQLHHK